GRSECGREPNHDDRAIARSESGIRRRGDDRLHVGIVERFALAASALWQLHGGERIAWEDAVLRRPLRELSECDAVVPGHRLAVGLLREKCVHVVVDEIAELRRAAELAFGEATEPAERLEVARLGRRLQVPARAMEACDRRCEARREATRHVFDWKGSSAHITPGRREGRQARRAYGLPD